MFGIAVTKKNDNDDDDDGNIRWISTEESCLEASACYWKLHTFFETRGALPQQERNRAVFVGNPVFHNKAPS